MSQEANALGEEIKARLIYSDMAGIGKVRAAKAAVDQLVALAGAPKDLTVLMEEIQNLTHKVICCGVAASHPDAALTTHGAYKEKWDSPQAEEVRKLRADRDRLLAAITAGAPKPFTAPRVGDNAPNALAKAGESK